MNETNKKPMRKTNDKSQYEVPMKVLMKPMTEMMNDQ